MGRTTMGRGSVSGTAEGRPSDGNFGAESSHVSGAVHDQDEPSSTRIDFTRFVLEHAEWCVPNRPARAGGTTANQGARNTRPSKPARPATLTRRSVAGPMR